MGKFLDYWCKQYNSIQALPEDRLATYTKEDAYASLIGYTEKSLYLQEKHLNCKRPGALCVDHANTGLASLMIQLLECTKTDTGNAIIEDIKRFECIPQIPRFWWERISLHPCARKPAESIHSKIIANNWKLLVQRFAVKNRVRIAEINEILSLYDDPMKAFHRFSYCTIRSVCTFMSAFCLVPNVLDFTSEEVIMRDLCSWMWGLSLTPLQIHAPTPLQIHAPASAFLPVEGLHGGLLPEPRPFKGVAWEPRYEEVEGKEILLGFISCVDKKTLYFSLRTILNATEESNRLFRDLILSYFYEQRTPQEFPVKTTPWDPDYY